MTLEELFAEQNYQKEKDEMPKYVKYWLTPNSLAKLQALREEHGREEKSLYLKAVTELEHLEDPFKSSAWTAWCTSDAEFEAIVEAASKVREVYGSQYAIREDVDRMMKLAAQDAECIAAFQRLNLTEHDMSFVRDALLSNAGVQLG